MSRVRLFLPYVCYVFHLKEIYQCGKMESWDTFERDLWCDVLLECTASAYEMSKELELDRHLMFDDGDGTCLVLTTISAAPRGS